MILPTKGVSGNRALLAMGADLTQLLSTPKSVSELWEEYLDRWDRKGTREKMTFDWYALALSTLYAIGAVEFTDDGRVRKKDAPS